MVVDEKKPHPVPVNGTPTTPTTTEQEKERKVEESYVYPRGMEQMYSNILYNTIQGVFTSRREVYKQGCLSVRPKKL